MDAVRRQEVVHNGIRRGSNKVTTSVHSTYIDLNEVWSKYRLPLKSFLSAVFWRGRRRALLETMATARPLFARRFIHSFIQSVSQSVNHSVSHSVIPIYS